MRISVAAINYFWPKEQVQAFYHQLCDAPVDIVYLGETVCAKRNQLNLSDWQVLAAMLMEAGKEVVLSSLALITSRAEIQMLKRLCASEGFLIEANDMAAVQLLSESKRPFVCGSSINIYNTHTLGKLESLGMCRWVMPVELTADTLDDILREARLHGIKVETEVLGLGRLPLAYSARCFTARAENRPKDSCELACLQDPGGRDLYSQESQKLFTLNGIQTLSGASQNLVPEKLRMERLGVDIFRVAPEAHMKIDFFRQLRRQLDANRTTASDEDSCNGYWHGGAGMERIAAEELM